MGVGYVAWLKGTISEVELHTMRSRLDRGKLNKAQRGELFHSVPLGYVLSPCGQVEFDPDEQVQAVVRLVFDKFDELGTIHGVFHYLLQQNIRLGGRRRCGPRRGELEWRRPSLSTLCNLLHHPYYAGAYAHGRRAIDPKRKRPGRSGSGRVVVPLSEWKVLLRDRLPAYISWERYLANQQRLQQNQSRPSTPGTPRSGRCLLGGLVRCGPCGCRMQPTYPHTTRSVYVCNRASRQGLPPTCPQVPAAVLDELLTEQVLHALEPAALQLSLHALADLAQERQRLERHWQQQLERARYDTEQAERRYQLVDPANRLVANTLEQRWEQALQAQRQLEEEYDRFVQQQPTELTEAQRQRLLALAQNIPGLWHAASTTPQQRKEIVRCLVEKVTVAVVQQSEQVRVMIQWAGGCQSEHVVQRPVCCYAQLSNYAALEERILALRAAGHSAVEIATTLNGEGWRPPKRAQRFSKHTVLQWLSRQGQGGPPPLAELKPGEWLLKDLARELGMELPALRQWRRRGWLHSRPLAARGSWIVWADAAELRRLRQLLEFGRQHPSAAYPKNLLIPKERQAN